MIKKFIRWPLTGLLFYGVYTETGVWTTISLFLILIGIEVTAKAIKDIIKEIT